MTIRTRLSLWYTGVLMASLFFMGGVMYYELVIERRATKAAGLKKEPMEDEVAEIVLSYGLPTVIVTIGVGWWLLRKDFAPLDDLIRAAEHLHPENLHERLPRTGRGDEVDRLSEVLNAMTARLHDSFKHIHEFTLHASHELKTPLAILHAEIETALRDPTTPPAQCEAFSSQLDELQRLTKIVEGLTLLTKADAGQVKLAREPVRVDELVRDSFEDAQFLAHAQRIKVDLVECAAVTVWGDSHRLRQLLLNLTDNAIKHNQPDGHVDITLEANGANSNLRISNTGPGIDSDALPRVFERFFRGEAARANMVEGSGLGLSIVHWIVKAHGGDIQITSAPGQTVVSVDLPLCLPVPACSSNEHPWPS